MYREKGGLIILESHDLYHDKSNNLSIKPNKLIGDDKEFLKNLEEKTRKIYKK